MTAAGAGASLDGEAYKLPDIEMPGPGSLVSSRSPCSRRRQFRLSTTNSLWTPAPGVAEASCSAGGGIGGAAAPQPSSWLEIDLRA